MLTPLALVLLLLWVAGELGPYRMNPARHLLLLFGLLLLLLGFAKARDAAAVRRRAEAGDALEQAD